ncbi:ATP-binding protein [Streptomyces sp. NPDC014986]|uniref:ATP-binding protein n=1 Tax=Streptomyces sp. NPDC014986 TaxID=3364934 RepID=UPI0036FBA207
MLETLDARLAQAHGGELGHLDFLQVLCQDEITRRETVAFQRRLQRAKFEQQVTLEKFDFTASSETARRPDPRPGSPALAPRR